MRLYITNLHGYSKTSIEMVAQNMVTDILMETFDAREFGVYKYDMFTDNDAMLNSRLDGILNAITNDDIMLLQTPTWNYSYFDNALIRRMKVIAPAAKLIVFVHDMPPYMMESERRLIPNYVEIYNQADVLIVPTEAALKELRRTGVTVQKVIIQHFWDHITIIDTSITPRYNKIINFAGNIAKFQFCKKWNFNNIKLAVTANPEAELQNPNIQWMGWYEEDVLLINALRKNGGFGLHWAEDPYWREYMKMNASYKLSLYLAAGLPVIIPTEHPEREYIVNRKLGIAVDSLEEAVACIEQMSIVEYKEMQKSVESFGKLLRSGMLTKKIVSEAICALYE